MNISNETIDVLKNFAAINPNIVINPGQVLKTISEAKNIMAIADIQEDFPQSFGIYDLNEFLSVISLIESPDIDFDSKFATIKSSTSSVKYYFSEPEILTTPQKDITMPECEFGVSITEEQLSQLKKAAAVLGHSELVLSGNDGNIIATISDEKDATANTFSFDLDSDNECKNDFNFVINIANLKLLPGDYFVSISSKLISNWTNVSRTAPINYFIALEKSSEFRV
tara:strand:- start:2860 stop:3537 length:678 start_codon:yes stop_codon:yes gene_type:complete